MGKYEEIADARALFGILESETMGEIKRKISVELKKWHPDTAGEGEKQHAEERIVRLVAAKKAILEYCDTFKISFDKGDIERHLSPEELWKKSFGADHVWGGNW